jgi:hypothetical protein
MGKECDVASNEQRDHALTVLGLKEPTDATEIARAFRRLVRSSHPDITGDTSPATTQRMVDVVDAYRTLIKQPRRPARVPRATAEQPPDRRLPRWLIVAGPTVVRPRRPGQRHPQGVDR